MWGDSRNPLDQERSPGGSSGGESGLIVSRCIPLSFGNDIGGSVRFPAAFCGLYSLKTTSFRVTNRGCCPTNLTRFYIPNTALRVGTGPIGISVQDLVIGAKL